MNCRRRAAHAGKRNDELTSRFFDASSVCIAQAIVAEITLEVELPTGA